MPDVDAIDTEGLDVSQEDMEELLKVDKDLWLRKWNPLKTIMPSLAEAA